MGQPMTLKLLTAVFFGRESPKSPCILGLIFHLRVLVHVSKKPRFLVCRFKTLFASSVLNLTEFVALRPEFHSVKKVLYFHENQLCYPVEDPKERDFYYGYSQILSW